MNVKRLIRRGSRIADSIKMARIPLSFCRTIVFVVITTACITQAKLIDLSHDHGKDTFMSIPSMPRYTTQLLFNGEITPGVFATWNSYSLSEHGGTHLDAPRHFIRDGMTLEQIPLENTIADGVMIDCAEEVAQNISYKLTLEKVKDWEEENGQIPMKAAVVINFNWSHRFTNSTLYFNPTDPNDADTFRFPTVSEEAIDFLVDERDINIIGMDCMGPDLTTTDFPVHVKMLAKGKMIAENLKDTHLLPKRGFRLHASPVKFVGGTGVQTRIYAMVHGDGGTGTGNSLSCSILLAFTSVIGQLLSRSFVL